MVWRLSRSGVFTTELGVFTKSAAVGVWKYWTPPKVQQFCCFLLINKVPAREKLVRRGMARDQKGKCPLCDHENETTEHMLLHYRMTWKIWSIVLKGTIECFEKRKMMYNV